MDVFIWYTAGKGCPRQQVGPVCVCVYVGFICIVRNIKQTYSASLFILLPRQTED